jgi:predicted amidophosphoribosyltransferase
VDAVFAPEPFVLPTFKTPAPALETFCPRCHAPNPPGRRSCIQCNTSLAAANGNTQPAGDPAAFPDQAVCPRCGHANRAGWGYCQECGGALPQAAGRTCPNCGNPLAASASFCGKCGTRM